MKKREVRDNTDWETSVVVLILHSALKVEFIYRYYGVRDDFISST